MATSHWLLKSEPEVYPWATLVSDGRTTWDGVRNHQARNNLAAMAKGDLVLFYHSHVAEVVGIARVARTSFPDPTADDPRWLAVELEPVRALEAPVSLETIKADRALAGMKLVTQSRLSVMPVEPAHYERILALAKAPARSERATPAGGSPRSPGGSSRSPARGRRR
ncbi:MAG TPA: EVE domain-containing protein [Myxococcota bacterium]|nr:EVE domain-containing protein [Myxococcota bacterium]